MRGFLGSWDFSNFEFLESLNSKYLNSAAYSLNSTRAVWFDKIDRTIPINLAFQLV